MTVPPLILGIETSCDETALALIQGRHVLSHQIHSQTDHTPYGGVVPELAARAHLSFLPKLLDTALSEASVSLSQVDLFAATAGPGLVGGLLMGLTFAKGLAYGLNKPFLAVNHLEAHALVPRFSENISFPYLLLLISGGHTQLVWVEGVGRYKVLGTTLDDAVGEAFDKSAKLLGLPYPGGPHIEILAQKGDPQAVPLPRPMMEHQSLNFSFSGLKTAVRHAIGKSNPEDLAASLQAAIGDILVDRVKHAIDVTQTPHVVVAGGVAANRFVNHQLKNLCLSRKIQYSSPPLSLCTDNGIMIAWAAHERYLAPMPQDLSAPPRPRWSLEEMEPPFLPTDIF